MKQIRGLEQNLACLLSYILVSLSNWLSFSLPHLLWQKHLCQEAGQPGEETAKLGVTREGDYSPELSQKMVGQGQKAKGRGGGSKAELRHVKTERAPTSRVRAHLHTAWELSSQGRELSMWSWNWDTCGMVGWLIWLECCDRCRGALQEKRAGKGSMMEQLRCVGFRSG